MTTSEHSALWYTLGAGAAVAALYTLRNLLNGKATRGRLPLPPGPKGLPVLGVTLDFLSESPWLVYDQWFKTFGDVVYVNLLGQPVLLLGSYEATMDLLEHRGAIYSDRMQSMMVGDLMDCADLLVLQTYGDNWRRSRKLLHPHVHTNAVSRYQPVQIAAARTFVRRLLSTKPDLETLPTLVRGDFAETILKVVYGLEVKTEEEKNDYIDLPAKVLARINETAVPGRFLVDLLHILRHIPAWVPGAGFHTFAREARDWHHRSREAPMKAVRAQMDNGTAPPSMVRSMLEGVSPDDQQAHDTIRDLGEVAFLAGSDTSVSSILAFFLAMMHFPDAQRAGQTEIDSVLGDRLPEFGDMASLPYVNAIVLETLRWLPAIPGGLPHYTSAEDTYRGYHIPKGTFVFGVAWSLLHDPDAYERPEDFSPERFLRRTPNGTSELDPAVRDPRTIAFGFGRRICPGRHLAEQSLFATIATILATVDILPALDKDGKDIIPPLSFIKGLISHPKPFRYRLRPRSARSADLLGEDLALL